VLTDVDLATRTAKFETADDVKADVLNVVPPQRAGAIARAAGVITANNRWCEVDFRSFESVRGKGVHVLGDAIQIAQAMPKSGHMANNHGKIAAAAILRMLAGQEPNPSPGADQHLLQLHHRQGRRARRVGPPVGRDKKTVLPVPNSGGLSPAMNEMEGTYANAWARNIWADMLA
jgi:hypothetical protein